jgi:phosphoribosylformylglycinamidine synthase
VQADGVDRLPRPVTGDELASTLLALVGSANLCDKSWVTNQYDRYVRGNSVLAQPEDAGMLRIDEESGLGVALATDGNGRFALLDPYVGAQLALAEAYRNVAVTGAQPVAVSDCLNFGSPEDAGVMWQFSQAIAGLVDGCKALGTPVTGGNVSFYNQTGSTPILPTPVVGVLGVIEDVRRRTPVGFARAADAVMLLGDTRDELAGSAWADVVHDHLGGHPPQVDLAHESRLAAVLIEAGRRRLLTSAHDLADGGLAQALVESCLRRGHGVAVELPEAVDPVRLAVLRERRPGAGLAARGRGGGAGGPVRRARRAAARPGPGHRCGGRRGGRRRSVPPAAGAGPGHLVGHPAGGAGRRPRHRGRRRLTSSADLSAPVAARTTTDADRSGHGPPLFTRSP